MLRLLLLLFPLVISFSAAKPTDYFTDIVVIEGGQVVQTMKLYVSGPKSRLDGMTTGPLGKMVAITRQDRGVSWTLFPAKKQYSETLLTGGQRGKVDLTNFDQIATKKEIPRREAVFGYACTKMWATVGNLLNSQPLVATAWVADSLQVPLRLETMGIIQENRNLKVGPQPAGFTKTGAPGMGFLGQIGGGGMLRSPTPSSPPLAPPGS